MITGVEDLTIDIGQESPVRTVTDATVGLRPGQVTALTGSSGSGKSTVVAALTGTLPEGAAIIRGTVVVCGADLNEATEREWRTVRGRIIGTVPQTPMTYFTPTRTVGSQLDETLTAHGNRRSVDQLMDQVELTTDVLTLFPHQLSGGMAQRMMIALALAGSPEVLISDEPTSGLDPALSAQILRLHRQVADDGAAVLLVTHDLRQLERSAIADHTVALVGS